MTWALAPMAGALWALALSRLRVRCASRTQKVMTVTVACLAAAVTWNVPVVWQSVATTGGAFLAIIGDHLLTLATEMLILVFVREIRGRGISVRAITRTTAVVGAATTTMLLLLIPTGAAMTYDSTAALYPQGWPWLTYWGITVVYGFWAFSTGTRFYWHYPRQAGARGEAFGFMLIGLGTTIALVITALRACMVISAPLSKIRIWDGWAPEMALALVAALCAAIVVGLMAKSATSWLARCRAWRSDRRSVATLEPLWKALTDAVPNITLDHRAMVSLMGPRLSQRGKLYRRMIEINDGLLALAAYTSAPLRQEALDQALASGEPARQAHVVADTVALQVALVRYLARAPVAQSSTHLVTRQSGDFSAEVQRLGALAEASSGCPLTAQITQRMLEMEKT